MINPAQLSAATGIKDITVITNFTNSINDTLAKYSINTPLRTCHFLAQVLEESNNLTHLVENLNYSSTGLTKTFPTHFTQDTAKAAAHNPEAIANIVYANRLGNTQVGDGWRFIGRGAVQLTGRANYTALSKDLGIDFITHPELLATPQYAILSAGWYWNKLNLNAFADKDDIVDITKKVNGGLNGEAIREGNLKKLKSLIK